MVGSIDVVPAESSPRPALEGKPVVLVPYYSAIEKECEEGLRALVSGWAFRSAVYAVGHRPVAQCDALACPTRRASIDCSSSTPISASTRAMPSKLLAGPSRSSRESTCITRGEISRGRLPQGVTSVVFGPAAPGLYPMLYAPTGFLRIHG